jgi:DNA-binding CsgD family transcriptional regulator
LAPHDQKITGTDEAYAMESCALSQGVYRAEAAVLVVTRDARILYANRMASGLLSTGSLICLDSAGRLKVFGSGSKRLKGVLEDLNLPEMVNALNTHSFAVAAGDGTLWHCHAVPFDLRSLFLLVSDARSGLDDRAFLFAFTPQKAFVGPVLTALQRFGLTLAEGEIALGLLQGLTPREIANQRLVSIHTVRNQIKAILLKTHSRRQIDIALFVARLED